MGSSQQDLQHNHTNLGTKRIFCHSTLLEIEITSDVSGNSLPEFCSIGRMLTQRDTPTPDSLDTEMMFYYDHAERERKQMHHSSGPMRIYRAGPDESDKSGVSSGGSEWWQRRRQGWRQRNWGL